MRHATLPAVLVLLAGLAEPALGAPTHNLMPVPAKITFTDGALPIDGTFDLVVTGARDPRVDAAAVRLVARLSAETGIPM
ncbi:MAG: hypothetical protein IMZ65_02090, partial [Planctomycetes bacterium]|nr:hypothetical protein [Planctomycetota bacterium]